MDFEHGKAHIMDALFEHRGIQHLVDIGADLSGNPVFVCDLAAQVIAMSHSTDIHKDFWAEFLPGGELIPQVSIEVARAGIYEQIFSSDKPVLGEFDFYPGRIFGARIRTSEGPVGIVTLIERETIGEDDLELLMVLSEAIVLEMAWRDMAHLPASVLSELANAVIDGTLAREELNRRLESTGVRVPGVFRVVVVGLEAGHAGVLLSFTQDRLEKVLPTSPCFNRHGRIVILLDVSRGEEVPVDLMLSCFSGLSIRVGVGGHVTDFADLARSYEQARTAMRFAEETGSPAMLADYDSWRVDDFLDKAARSLDLGQYIDPIERRIREYDLRERSHLIETLEAYLRCANNAQAAARLLGIHKNTMYSRLDRIQELFGVDLENGEACLSLWLSLRMERAMLNDLRM